MTARGVLRETITVGAILMNAVTVYEGETVQKTTLRSGGPHAQVYQEFLSMTNTIIYLYHSVTQRKPTSILEREKKTRKQFLDKKHGCYYAM